MNLLKLQKGPGWCGSVGWVSYCKVKDRPFDSQSGHVPESQVLSWVAGVQEAADRCFSCSLMFLFLFLSLPPPSLKINKLNL